MSSHAVSVRGTGGCRGSAAQSRVRSLRARPRMRGQAYAPDTPAASGECCPPGAYSCIVFGFLSQLAPRNPRPEVDPYSEAGWFSK